MGQPEPLFDPNYLNLEYLFNQVFVLFERIVSFFNSISGGAFLEYLKFFLSILAIFFITVILYSLVRIHEIRKEEDAKYRFAEPEESNGGEERERWELVQKHLNSDNPSDWRLSIIEADAVLDELVQKMGYHGDNLGERMKAVEVSDFQSIRSAWEAHKVRNQIAHEGMGFELSQREARRVVGLYEEVFREFKYI